MLPAWTSCATKDWSKRNFNLISWNVVKRFRASPSMPNMHFFESHNVNAREALARACILIVWMEIANGHSKFSTYLPHLRGGLCHKRQGCIMNLFGPKSFKRWTQLRYKNVMSCIGAMWICTLEPWCDLEQILSKSEGFFGDVIELSFLSQLYVEITSLTYVYWLNWQLLVYHLTYKLSCLW